MYKYLYLDDENSSAIASALSRSKLIDVEFRKPCSFEKQLKEIETGLPNLDGLILDWKLDSVKNGESCVEYRAASLAQEIRTKSQEWGKDIPIILCSTENKLKGSYSDDLTSHDLFDQMFIKRKVDYTQLSKELFSLAKGYKTIAECKVERGKTARLNMLDIKSSDPLDERIFQRFSTEHKYPTHEYVNVILKELILKPGPLISEELLASRLGIDKGKSSDWETLLEKELSQCRYTGVFSDSWLRWWMFKLHHWWDENIDDKNSLARLNAEERVELIKNKTALRGIVAAKPLPKTHSSNFWTICEHFRKPLDPIEGLRIDSSEPLSWQETQYLSLEAILESHGREHPCEKERVKYYKKTLRK